MVEEGTEAVGEVSGVGVEDLVDEEVEVEEEEEVIAGEEEEEEVGH